MSCPVLKTLVNEGWLQPDDQGWVSEVQLYSSLRRLGLDRMTSRALLEVAEAVGGGRPRQVNLNSVFRSRLQHNADFYRQQRLDQLLGDRDVLTAEDLGEAARQRLREDPGLHGRLQGGAELIGLLTVFGRRVDGRLVLTRDDLQRLYVENRFPRDWSPRPWRKMSVPFEAARFALSQFL